MPYRKIVLANNEIYHVVNRSVAQIPIFEGIRDYQRALEVIDFYRRVKPSLSFSHYKRLPKEEKERFYENLKKKKHLVEILTFCLMPNHFHFLLRQNKDGGISTFMRTLQNSYARYFNTKYKRAGALFQSMFKAVRIETDEQLIHVSRYIHLNPVSAYLIEINDLEDYPWSSFPIYLGKSKELFINPNSILSHFKSKSVYKEFVFDQADYQRKLQRIKNFNLVLEE